MKETIVITEKEYGKGKKAFDADAGAYDWRVTPASEEAVASAVSATGARVAVLGVEKYSGALYATLAGNSGGGGALIARYGVGYDGIDLHACKQHGIFLAITPGALDRSVAEHAMGLILALARNIPFGGSEMRQGRFTGRPGVELAGKTLLIAGFGKIGRRVAGMAALGFDMRVSAYDALPLEALARAEGCGVKDFMRRFHLASFSDDFDEAAGDADILSLHMPVLPSTRGFMDERRFSRMKDGAFFINTSRGKLVDESALYDALSSGKLGGAALDVFEREPYEPVAPDRDLRALDKVVLTPHVASNTKEANENMQAAVLRNIYAFLGGDFYALSRVELP